MFGLKNYSVNAKRTRVQTRGGQSTQLNFLSKSTDSPCKN